MTRLAMFHWTMYGVMTFFFPISFSAIMCIALVTYFSYPSTLLFSYIYHSLFSTLPSPVHFSISGWNFRWLDVSTHCSTILFSMTNSLLCSLRKLNTCYVRFSQFPPTLMPILTVTTDSLPRFNARKQLRERLEEPLELKLPTNVLFGQPESQNMLFLRSNPFSTSASAETKYSEYAFSARGALYWLTLSRVNDNFSWF